jgi:hypothetical protein
LVAASSSLDSRSVIDSSRTRSASPWRRWEEFHQVVGRYGQVEGGSVIAAVPADVLQQAEVFAELDAEAFGGGEVLGLLQGDPEIAHGAEVIADQLVEAVSLVAVDLAGGAGHGALL